MDNAIEIAKIQESLKSAHHRISEVTEITTGIHDLSKSVAQMATEVRLLTQRMNDTFERVENGQKAQGERIGNIERVVQSIQRNEKRLEDHEKRLDGIEKEPATKWKNLTWLIIAGVATAVVGLLLGRVL